MPIIQVKVQVNTRLLLFVLNAAAGFIIAVGILAAILLAFTPYKSALGIITLFNMDSESNVPTYYSSLILAIAALILFLIVQDKKEERDYYWWHWFGLSFGFIFMSLDETASIHEFIVALLKHFIHINANLNFVTGILGFFIIGVLLTFYCKFLMHLPPKVRQRFIFSGIVYATGAFGAEIVGGYILEKYGLGRKSGYYLTEVIIEESLEIIGVLLFIKYLLLYIEENLSGKKSSFKILGKETEDYGLVGKSDVGLYSNLPSSSTGPRPNPLSKSWAESTKT